MNRPVREQPLRENPPPSNETNTRMLIVGREIVLSGEITSCDCLIVEGTVRANVACNELRIAKGGLFTGAAAVANAEITGRFEGDLQIAKHLRLRAGGAIAAKVRYRQLEVERGGILSGDIQALDAAIPAPSAAPRPISSSAEAGAQRGALGA